eukprot:scaffold177516_cov19-Prasinocladus_malaysianus.AAC.1
MSTLYALSCFAGGSLHLQYYAADFMPGVESAQLPQALCGIDGMSLSLSSMCGLVWNQWYELKLKAGQ